MNHFPLCVALALCVVAAGWSWGEPLADGQTPRRMLNPEDERWFGSSTNPIPGISITLQRNDRDYWGRSIQEMMSHLGINVGNTNDICRSWDAPNEISVGQDRYDVRIANGGGFSVATKGATNEAARCYMVQYADARSARKSEFGCRLGGRKSFSPLSGSNRRPWEVQTFTRIIALGGWSDSVAHYTEVVNVDSVTNAFYIVSKDGREKFDALVYKNLVLSISAPTNALEIAVALMNAGLSEDERIVR